MEIGKIQKEMDQLKMAESQIDNSTLEECKKALHILIPERIGILNSIKRLTKGGFR